MVPRRPGRPLPLTETSLQPLERSLYRTSAAKVAPRLLGHLLVRQMPAGLCAGIIVETEAYLDGDPACHGFCGPTARNGIMFGDGGFAYVYFIYGCHHCFNAVCGPLGTAEAVLIRAVEPCEGVPLMQVNRPVPAHSLTNGPGKLCSALAIDRCLDGSDLCDASTPVFIARNSALQRTRRALGPIVTTTRIGINRARDLPLRHYLSGSAFVSRRPAST